MTLYTALGHYELKENKNGERRPHIYVGNSEYELDIWEMILWSSLAWNIYTFTEISREFYKKEREAHILGEESCEAYLDRMEKKGLVACGHGVTANAALRDLLARLYVIPTTARFVTKLGAFLHLTLIKRVPFKVTKNIFARPHFSEAEKRILKLTSETTLSVEECCQAAEVLQMPEGDVVSSIASLYLNKHILFDGQ